MSRYAPAMSPRGLSRALESAAKGTAQKVIAARSGLGSDQISKIFSGETEDPRWSTMIRLLRDGLGVSLDAFIGGKAETQLSPYDTNDDYRRLIDALARMDQRDRKRVIDFVEWIASSVKMAAVPGDNVLEFVPAKMPEVPKEMTEDELRSIANALGDVVEFRKGALWKEYEVPLVATVSAGKGIEIFETYEKVRQIPEYYWKAGARAVFKVRGHSMLDMGITDNDLLFVKPTAKPRSGEIVVCSLNGAAFVKEFERTKDGVRLISHSTSFEPMPVTDNDDLRVFGVVLGRTGDLTGERKKK